MSRRLGLHLGNLPREAIRESSIASIVIFCSIMGPAYWATKKRRSDPLADVGDGVFLDLVADQGLATSTVALAVAMTAVLTLIYFFLAVHHATLHARKLAALADQNTQLQLELESTRSEKRQSTDHILSSIGQELHDGPVQLLGVLSLRLSEPIKARKNRQTTPGDHELLARAIDDLRKIAVGLVLPQLDSLSTAEALRFAVAQHEEITGTSVTSEIGELPICSPPQKRCLYRVVREALNNAYRHADGNGQRVRASADMNSITVMVSDSGADLSTPRHTPRREGSLGLEGLRQSVETLDGSFEVRSQADGTHVSATISIIAQ